MNHLESTKTDARISASVATNATHSHEIDTLGYEYLSVDVVFGAYAAATNPYATVLKLQQSDTSGSGQTDLAGYTVTAGAGATTPAKNGAVCRYNVDLRGKRRYFTVVATPGGTAAISIASVARLGKGHENPFNATSAGVNNYVSG